MKRSTEVPLVIAFAILGAAAPPISRGESSGRTLQGGWEMVMASPKRPWILHVDFKPEGDGWTGTMSVRGLPDFPLADIRSESGHIHFQMPPELDAVIFEGTLTEDEIVGQVTENGQPTPTRLTRVIPLLTPANRLESWQQDLDFAFTRLAEYDRSFTPDTRKQFQKAMARLKLELPRKNDNEILVALSHAVALADNAHTWLRLDPTQQGLLETGFPIRFWWFSDGPYVVRAATRYEKALHCRVIAIDGHELSQAKKQVTELFAGNDSWANYLSPLYLTSPDILFGLGVIRTTKQAAFTFEHPDGTRFTIPILSETVDREAMANESWQEISPLTVTGRPPFGTALTFDSAALPLYLRHPDQPYWFEFLPATGILYFQYNHSDDAAAGPDFDEFGASLLSFVRQHPIRGFVVDLRLNSGGNLDVAKAFVRSLGQDEAINRAGHLFVITGNCTFSAGIYHAAQMKQFTQAIFVGEPVGDRLDFWAEGGDLVLPNSHAVIHYSNGFHRYSGLPYPQHQPYYEELSIRDLAPDISAPLSSKDYFAGRDPALEAIEARLRQLR